MVGSACALRVHSEGRDTNLFLEEGGYQRCLLKKVTFQLSPESWLGGSQVKEKDEGKTFWAENEVVLFLFNKDLSYFNPK